MIILCTVLVNMPRQSHPANIYCQMVNFLRYLNSYLTAAAAGLARYYNLLEKGANIESLEPFYRALCRVWTP